mmetsp:Transcript_157/g.230  ORF Transcript_157/g.230 Transcript_157/m.230 type:complete len:179 (+) Transcript_157:192-728(+)
MMSIIGRHPNSYSIDDVASTDATDTCSRSSTMTISLASVDRSASPLHVSFDTITIRDYDITLGDNPTCSYGPPISLDWNYTEMDPIPLEHYEKTRHPRRKMYQMHMLSRQRANLLKNLAGTTDDEMIVAMDEIRVIQKQRNATRMSLPFIRLHELSETVNRRWIKRVENSNNSNKSKE